MSKCVSVISWSISAMPASDAFWQRCSPDANRVLSSWQLVDRAWGDQRLPAHPMSALQMYISLLRRSVAADGQVAIIRQGSGYKLTADPEAVDLHRVSRLAEQARTASDDEAAILFQESLALWRGEPFAGLDTPWINAVRTTLARQQLAVQMDLIDVQLRRGLYAAMAVELAGLAAATRSMSAWRASTWSRCTALAGRATRSRATRRPGAASPMSWAVIQVRRCSSCTGGC